MCMLRNKRETGSEYYVEPELGLLLKRKATSLESFLTTPGVVQACPGREKQSSKCPDCARGRGNQAVESRSVFLRLPLLDEYRWRSQMVYRQLLVLGPSAQNPTWVMVGGCVVVGGAQTWWGV